MNEQSDADMKQKYQNIESFQPFHFLIEQVWLSI